ncbi:deoxyribonuclease IV [Candidatus Woesebacteria bacterium]|nr:deoxyribonuclease IV [Candidatus Woesebacteria bacterium]
MMKRKIGAHVSAAGGLDAAVVAAASMGCSALQLFSGSPRIWYKKPLEQVAVDQFFIEREKLGVDPVITHALYLVNLASEKSESVTKSIHSLEYELAFDAKIKGGGVVVHLGSHQGRGWESVREQIAGAIIEILQNTPENSCFLIENAAGQNGKIGGDLAEVRELLERAEEQGKYVSTGRLGWCFDTCHAHAAGYYLDKTAPTETLFAAEKITRGPQSALATIESLGLWDSLKCIHVNDSRDPFGSGRDRHANLGEGSIPQSDLRAFLARPEVSSVPLILEVPGIDGEGPDAENVKRLKTLVGESA